MSPERDGGRPRWVVRHACAGRKEDWDGDDDVRPLDHAGQEQATALAEVLAPDRPGRLVASPTRRCIDTLLPLGQALDLPVDTDPALRAATGPQLLALLATEACAGAVVCTHGEVMQPALAELRSIGLTVPSDVDEDALLLKGGAWRLEPVGDGWRLELTVPIVVPTCPRHEESGSG